MTDRWPDPPPLFDIDEVAPAASETHPAGTGSDGELSDVDEFASRVGSESRSSTPRGSDSAGVPSPETARRGGSSGLLDLVAVFDLETTGTDVENDRVVTAFVGLIDSAGHVLRSDSWLADPGVEIPDGAAAVHGISTERARAEGRPAGDVVREIVAAVRGFLAEGIPLVAYNASYDLSLLRHEAGRHGVAPLDDPRPIVDPFVIDKALDRYRKGKRTLDLVAAHYGVGLDDAHEASADAIAAGRVAIALAERFADDLADSLDGVHDQQIEWARDQAASLTEYFVKIGKLAPGEALDGTWPVR